MTGQAALLRFRRMLGLYASADATLHFSTYPVLDQRGYWTQEIEDIVKRP